MKYNSNIITKFHCLLMLQHVLLAMQRTKCTKTVFYYKLQIFLCAYNRCFSITGYSKAALSTLLHKIFSPRLHIWEERGQGNNGRKNADRNQGFIKKVQTHP